MVQHEILGKRYWIKFAHRKIRNVIKPNNRQAPITTPINRCGGPSSFHAASRQRLPMLPTYPSYGDRSTKIPGAGRESRSCHCGSLFHCRYVFSCLRPKLSIVIIRTPARASEMAPYA
jgi:hypothetical protein